LPVRLFLLILHLHMQALKRLQQEQQLLQLQPWLLELLLQQL
jgi:hypothetical protein